MNSAVSYYVYDKLAEVYNFPNQGWKVDDGEGMKREIQ